MAGVLLLLFGLSGCDINTLTMSEFEKFAYEGCLTEGKYSKSICACNAGNLDNMLTADEKVAYKRAALGDMVATIQLLGITNKLMNAIMQCAD